VMVLLRVTHLMLRQSSVIAKLTFHVCFSNLFIGSSLLQKMTALSSQ
jgi:hypothetical protein